MTVMSCQVPPEWVARTVGYPVGWDRRARSLHQELAAVGVDPTDGCPFVQAAHVSAGSNVPVTRIVIHGTVSRTYAGAALDVARYFASPSSGGSAHYVVDPATVVQCVREASIAWHAPPNPHTLGVEFCDLVDWTQAQRYDSKRFPTEAAWAARWDLTEFDAMLRLGARVVRALADRYGVPLSLIGPSELLAGHHGQCSHLSVSQAWHQTDHHDPGTTFPWSRFMAYVRDSHSPEGEDDDMTPDQAAQLAAANENAAEARRMIGVLLGALTPATATEAAAAQNLRNGSRVPGIDENAAEARRQGAVLLAARAPGDGEKSIVDQIVSAQDAPEPADG